MVKCPDCIPSSAVVAGACTYPQCTRATEGGNKLCSECSLSHLACIVCGKRCEPPECESCATTFEFAALTANIGKCRDCASWTSSGTFKLCSRCALLKQHCVFCGNDLESGRN
jgi:hypothetical protein